MAQGCPNRYLDGGPFPLRWRGYVDVGGRVLTSFTWHRSRTPDDVPGKGIGHILLHTGRKDDRTVELIPYEPGMFEGFNGTRLILLAAPKDPGQVHRSMPR